MRTLIIAAMLLTGCKADGKTQIDKAPGSNKDEVITNCPSNKDGIAMPTALILEPSHPSDFWRVKDYMDGEIGSSSYDNVVLLVKCKPQMTAAVTAAYADQKITYAELDALWRKEFDEQTADKLVRAKEKLRRQVGPFTDDEKRCMSQPRCHLFYGQGR